MALLRDLGGNRLLFLGGVSWLSLVLCFKPVLPDVQRLALEKQTGSDHFYHSTLLSEFAYLHLYTESLGFIYADRIDLLSGLRSQQYGRHQSLGPPFCPKWHKKRSSLSGLSLDWISWR